MIAEEEAKEEEKQPADAPADGNKDGAGKDVNGDASKEDASKGWVQRSIRTSFWSSELRYRVSMAGIDGVNTQNASGTWVTAKAHVVRCCSPTRRGSSFPGPNGSSGQYFPWDLPCWDPLLCYSFLFHTTVLVGGWDVSVLKDSPLQRHSYFFVLGPPPADVFLRSDEEEECNCYGAGFEGECCRTCEDVRTAYRRKGWRLDASAVPAVRTHTQKHTYTHQPHLI